jgi:hypothetical protein
MSDTHTMKMKPDLIAPRGSSGKTGYRWRMRCNTCAAAGRSYRFTLKRHPDLYHHLPKCPRCGEKIRLHSAEEQRRRELAKRTSCTCSAYPFPHRSGSLRFCDHHPLINVDGTDQECLDYQACLETPRSGWM